MKISRFKLKLGPAKYGWIKTEINNPLINKRPIKIDHSGVFPFYDDLINVLIRLKFKKKAELMIDEEGYETILTFTNYGNIIKVEYKQTSYVEISRYNYSYRFKDFVCYYSKRQFTKEFRTVVLQHYLKYKEGYVEKYYKFMFDIHKMKKL